MNDRLKNILLGFSALTALALGGAAIAGGRLRQRLRGQQRRGDDAEQRPAAGPRTTAVGRDTAER
jgi:hypothetical protein